MNTPEPPSQVLIPCGSPDTWSCELDADELARHISWCSVEALPAKAKGERLEHLLCWLLTHLPGLVAKHSDIFSSDRSQEIDILFWNEQLAAELPSFGSTILAECKNWVRPVDSSDVTWFDWKLRLSSSSTGFMLAANGVTMSTDRKRAAAGILTTALRDVPSRAILVLTLSDVASLKSTEDLRNLIIDKRMKLSAQAPFD